MEINYSTYLPFAVAVVSATLGYFFGSRTKKNDRIILYTQENLKDVVSPFYHEMIRIMNRSLQPKQREDLLDNFFEMYMSNNTFVYKLGNLNVLDSFYDLNLKYLEFKQNRDVTKWNEFWHSLEENFFNTIKKEYRGSISLVYHQFKWQQYIHVQTYWKRIYFELVKFLYDTAIGMIAVSLILIYFSGLFKFFGLGVFAKEFLVDSLLFFGFSVVLAAFLTIINTQYSNMSSNTKQIDWLDKKLSKILNWRKFSVEKKDFSDVPNMYEKKLLD
ncbi:hypothetical protein [Paenibacillus sp. 1P03SA]|uniref:hypothetical protein n=1 Tax=Paenibacillus sp. 1P03SA TaxID=3132294 RepID=UPI00399EF542